MIENLTILTSGGMERGSLQQRLTQLGAVNNYENLPVEWKRKGVEGIIPSTNHKFN